MAYLHKVRTAKQTKTRCYTTTDKHAMTTLSKDLSLHCPFETVHTNRGNVFSACELFVEVFSKSPCRDITSESSQLFRNVGVEVESGV
jgi:hypothetical protein